MNVGKLVVTEGHFSEVITYKNQQKYLMDMISFEKKALIVVNANVTVAYDLHQMKYDIDEKNKRIVNEFLELAQEYRSFDFISPWNTLKN